MEESNEQSPRKEVSPDESPAVDSKPVVGICLKSDRITCELKESARHKSVPRRLGVLKTGDQPTSSFGALLVSVSSLAEIAVKPLAINRPV